MRHRLLSSLSVGLALAAGTVACTDNDAPGGHVLAKTTQLVQYDSCSALETDLEDMLIREAWVNIDRYGENGWGSPEAGDSGGMGGGGGGGGGRQEGVDYSGTNNQENGVDEADIVKTDGYHVYALNGNRLHILGVPAFGDLVPESVTQIEGHPHQMLFDKDAGRAVVFSYIDVYSLPTGHPLRALTGAGDNDDWWWRATQLTKITVLDISDRTDVKLVREVYFEGWYQTARKIDTSVRVSTYSIINNQALWGWWELMELSGNNKSWVKQQVAQQIHAMSLSQLIPNMYLRTPDGNFTTNSLSTSSCRSFYRPTDSHARGISSIISFDFLNASFAWDADHVVSNWATFYSSQDKIVLAEPAHDWWWYWWYQDDPDQLNLHVFDIANPGKSRYVGSGRIDGQINDQFSIDEEDGVFRVATTTNVWWRWWVDGDEEPPVMENHVWTLEQQGSTIATIGHVGGIAPGERITAARFLGEKGYLVTFRQTDPLWTIDLSDKYAPTVVGELIVPGFSTYLHPIGTNRLLTIGYGGDAMNANWRTTIATFDVNNFAHPALTATLPLDNAQGWGWSEANWEHKAFQYFAPKKLLAVPQSNYEYTGGYYRYLSKLEVIDVDDATGALAKRGSIDHSSYYTSDNYWSYLQIRRSIFMGDYIYAISDKAITVHRTNDLGQVGVQQLPGYSPGDYYWWW
ncbi:MAG: beta-propeller domain-containing protein [Kofleriaceae bacterium]